MYRVLYRKWRPQTFDDVVGQPQVTRALASQVRENRLSHAYLFTGSRGTGKTSCAKIFSKAVNCLHPVNGNPCNECEICRGIDNGTILDISEIDAASNRGIDDIRVLRDEANFTPSMAKFRIFIIDEVHMLTIEAFNALLKTLEEPPEHVKFILATTEIQKLPATILSRCQRYDFRRIEPEIIADRIIEIAAAENAVLEREAAMLIARIADGAMRDALSLLDRCISVSDRVTANDVSAAAGLMGREYLFRLCRAIKNHDTSACLTMLGELHNASCDTERLCTELISLYRDLLISKTVKSPENLIIGTSQELSRIKELSAEHTESDLLNALSVLSSAIEAIKKTQNRRIEAELAFIRLCACGTESDSLMLSIRITELEKKLEQLEKNGIGVNNDSDIIPGKPSPALIVPDEASGATDIYTPADEPHDSGDVIQEDDFVLPWNDLPEDAEASAEESPVSEEEAPLPFSKANDNKNGVTDERETEIQQEPLPFGNPQKPVPPKTAQPINLKGEIPANGEIDNRTWVKIAMEAERTCKPLIGILAKSSARVQGSVVYVSCENSAFPSLMKIPPFASALEKAIQTVTGKQCGVKPE